MALISEGKESSPASVRVFLNDISEDGIGFYLTQPLMVGTEVRLSFKDPSTIAIKGAVAWCEEFEANSHVLSQVRYTHRVGLEIRFASEEEKSKFTAWTNELSERTLLKAA